mmetsp:Transcript_34761/g.81985  ORF Transcript_34761/g.81985 Transcript_34761/m.81985 type:complete len:462 (+) Transcript_34761:44-1429(+)
MAAHALLHLLVLGAGQGVVRQPRVGVRRALPRAIVVLHGGSGGGLPPSGGGGIGGGGDGGSGGGGGGGSDNDDEKRPFQHGTGGTGAPEGPKRMVPWPVAWAMGMIATAFAVLAAEHLVPGLNVPIFALLTLRSTAPPEKGIWTTREEVEQHFRDYLRNPSEQVLIVAGPKGTGKSTAALHAVRDVRGTAYVSLSGEDKLSKQVLVAVGMPFIERHTEISRPALARMCKAAALLGRRWFGDKTWLPTLLVEIDQTVQPGYIKDAVATLKYLAHDARACRAILVLSDGNAVLGLDPDPDRRNYLWMGDFSEAEARVRMNTAKVLVGEDELREAVLGVTTRPAALSKLCAALSAAPPNSSELIVRAFVEVKRAEAEIRVIDLLACDDSKTNKERGLHFRHLLKDMLKNGGLFHEEKAAYMIPSNRAAPSFKEYDAIMFDLTTLEYRFNTAADMHAAAQLLAEL